MKILFLSDNFPPEVNAIATRVYERAKYWVEWGHEVTVVTSVPNFPQGKVYPGYKNKWHQVEYIDGIKVVRVKTFIAANSGFMLRILDFLSYIVPAWVAAMFQARPDVVACTSPQFFVAVTAWLLALFKRRPFVFEVSDLWPASILAVGAMKKSFLIKMLEKIELFLYRRAKAVVLLTAAFKRNLVSRKISPDKLFVVRNGVELASYSPREKDAALLEELGLRGKFVVGYIGTHGPAQSLENFSPVAQLLEGFPVHFLFVGTGAKKQALVGEVRRLDLQNVTCLNPVPKQEVARYWSVCDVALVHLAHHPVFAEVIPSKIFEAMGMGLPILFVGPKGEASEVIEQDNAGVCCTSGQPNEVAELLQSWQADSGRIVAYKQAAIRAVECHTREKQARAYMEVLESSIT